jgi:hypothetical protein
VTLFLFAFLSIVVGVRTSSNISESVLTNFIDVLYHHCGRA